MRSTCCWMTMILFLSPTLVRADAMAFVLKTSEYEDRVHAGWLAQVMGVMLTLPFEHKVSSVRPVTAYPKTVSAAIVDDDWYYEIVALRGFEQHGAGLTVDQLGALWLKHRCGTWGSSKYARLAMEQGIAPADAGLPQNNRLWWSIGPMFSCELYGMLAPGRPDLAGKLVRELGRINGHAEGLDAGVFSAGLVSIAFREDDPHEIVREAATLIHPQSPMRQAIDQVLQMAQQGSDFRTVCSAIEDRWHFEYPGTNNAVANGAILAACVWFGEGNFLKSINLAASAGDFIDADNIAATAGAVVGVQHGIQALPAHLVGELNDRIVGSDMGGILKLSPPVDERFSDLAKRTARVGCNILAAARVAEYSEQIAIPRVAVETQPLQQFRLAELTRNWSPDWTLERAGFGGGDGGMRGIRGMTYLDGPILATYPRDEVRGLVLRRTVTPVSSSTLSFAAGVDPGRAWILDIYLDNNRVIEKIIQAPPSSLTRHWEAIRVNLSKYAGRTVEIRLFQRVLVDGMIAGSAYWKDLQVGADD